MFAWQTSQHPQPTTQKSVVRLPWTLQQEFEVTLLFGSIKPPFTPLVASETLRWESFNVSLLQNQRLKSRRCPTTNKSPNFFLEKYPRRVRNPWHKSSKIQKDYMDVSENNGTPKSSILIGFSHYKPSVLGYPYFRKHPYILCLVLDFQCKVRRKPVLFLQSCQLFWDIQNVEKQVHFPTALCPLMSCNFEPGESLK